MADAYDPTKPLGTDLAKTVRQELYAIKIAITGAVGSGSRGNMFLQYAGDGSVIGMKDVKLRDALQATHVNTTAGATLAQLETNVNAIINALVTAGIMAP